MDGEGPTPSESEEQGPKKRSPVFILTPQGTLREITGQADILKSLMEKYKVDGDSFKALIQEEIEDLKRQLMEEAEDERPEGDKD